jgi:hypothetical protein
MISLQAGNRRLSLGKPGTISAAGFERFSDAILAILAILAVFVQNAHAVKKHRNEESQNQQQYAYTKQSHHFYYLCSESTGSPVRLARSCAGMNTGIR